MNRSKKITEGALFVALYLLFLMITFYVPIADLVTVFVLPVPVIIYAMRYDWKASILMVLVAIAVSSMFATVFSIPITIMMALGGVLIGNAIRKKLSPYETWARGTIGFVIGIVVTILFAQWLFNINFVQELEATIEQSIKMTEGMMAQLGMNTNTEDLQQIYEQMRQITDLLPVGLVMTAIVLAFISQWLGYKVLNRMDKQKLHFPPFRSFRLPQATIWFYFLSIIVMWFQLDPNHILYLGALNVSNLAALLITIQGFSFVFFYTKAKGLSKAIPVITIVFAFLFPFIGLYLVRILGIIDVGFSLRDRIQPKA
jgi:uncharacterized protein YybS (DUF2232 family)